jgi:K+-transporting ATPase ATPase C chain
MLRQLRPAIVMILAMTLLTGLIYPLSMTGLAQLFFPRQAGGSLIARDGKIIGSELIGQNFTAPHYFHGRPSATVDTDPNDASKTVPSPYNASNSAASNAGPTSAALTERVKEDVKKLKAENPRSLVPADLATTSASGLDPDITIAAAYFQIPRVAKARRIAESRLREIVDESIEGRALGVFGEPHVNVLRINLRLDKDHPVTTQR